LLTQAGLLLERGEFDIVHCQFGTWGLRYLNLHELGASGGKLIVNFRGYDISETVHQKGNGVYRELFARSDHLITNCVFFKSRLLQIGAPADRLTVIPSGIDCSRFRFAERQRPEDGVTRIVMVGRLVKKKGVEFALRAIAELVARGKKIEFQVIGDGPLRESLSKLLSDLGLGGHARLSGPQDQSEIIETLSCAHVFVAPSVTTETGDQEGSINVLKEAMAMGLPVVSTLHAGIPEIVQDGRSGFLVPERDTAALADRIEYLVDHPEVWPAMGRNGREFVESHFDINALNESLIDVYRRVCAAGKT
jgi:colanic acid/amylovoran biosynthesis glycosyltransferase